MELLTWTLGESEFLLSLTRHEGDMETKVTIGKAVQVQTGFLFPFSGSMDARFHGDGMQELSAAADASEERCVCGCGCCS